MKNLPERQKDILSIIANLDISPTMYKNATEKYTAITKFLSDCGIEADMYPQGSFAFGTVVRPNAKNPSASYDLDFICQVKGNRTDISPSGLRKKIEDALTSSGIYGGKLEVYEECFTIRPLAKLSKAVKVADTGNQGKSEGKALSAVTVTLREDTKSFEKTDGVFNKDTFS